MAMALSEPVPISAGRKAFRRDGMGYVWDIADHNALLHVDYLSSRFNQIEGEVTVRLNGKHLHLARLKLTNTMDRKTLQAHLDSLTSDFEIPWQRYIEQFCVGVVHAERRGDETQHTGRTARQPLKYLAEPICILHKFNMFFAPGGHGKGMLTCGMCVAVATRRGFAGMSVMEARPIYFDWEDDFETFQDRVNLIADGMQVEVPQIAYRRMHGSVTERINEMAKAIATEGATFGIIDSYSAASGGGEERWDVTAQKTFDALDQIRGMTWWIIDHVAADKVKDPAGKAFGTIQKMNRVRNAWELRSEQEPGSEVVHMRLTHAKWNHTGKKPPIGIRMEISDKCEFAPEDPATSVQGITPTIADKMAFELSDGPLATGVLAVSLNVDSSQVRQQVQRYPDRFERDTNGRIRLVPDHVQEESDAIPF